MESLLRSYRLCKLSNIPPDKSLEKIYDSLEFIRNIIRKVEIRTDKVTYPEWEFYFIGDVCYFEYCRKNSLNILYCRDKDFWNQLEVEFEYSDIEKLFKEVMIEENFKCNAQPVGSTIEDVEIIEEHFNKVK